jgi:D-alanine-D-alanine ligase
MGRADDLAGLRALLAELVQFSDDVLVETAISGVEFSCGVIENPDGSIRALPPVEIRPKTPYFDFTAKYTDNASVEIVPAPRPQTVLNRVMEIALAAHRVTGCRGYSRTDVIQSGDALHTLEINTLPGMTSNSLLPKEFVSEGGTFTQLIDLMIQTALPRGL